MLSTAAINFILFFNFEAPTLIMERKENPCSSSKIHLRWLQKILLLFILAASIFPIGMKEFSYSAMEDHVIWAVSYLCILPIYWFVFARIVLKGKGTIDSLRLVSGIAYFIRGFSLRGSLERFSLPLTRYLPLLIPSLILIVVSIRCLRLRKKTTA